MTVTFFHREPVIAETVPEPPPVVISEVMWAGTEYVELFNNTDKEILLDGWTLERLRNDESKNVTIEFEEEDTIAAEGYFLLERKTFSDETDPLFEEGLGRVVRGNDLKLIDGGEKLELRNSAGDIIDIVEGLDNWPFGSKTDKVYRSMERIDSTKTGPDQCNWHTYSEEEEVHGRLGTPAKENSKFINPMQAVIEAGSLEIVEGEEVELDGGSSMGIGAGDISYAWNLGDGTAHDEKIAIHKFDEAGAYDISLTVSECEFEDIETVTVQVLEPEDDESVDPVPNTYKKVSLSDVRSEDSGQLVSVEGVINALPGTFSARILYIEDASLPIGLQIYFYKADFPSLKLGEKLQIDGELSTVLGEVRLKIAETDDLVSKGQSVTPTPHSMSTGDVGASVEGALVSVTGIVTSSSGNTFYIDDGSGNLRVVIKNATGIDKPATRKGTEIKITGVVSRTTLGYRLMPRIQSDVELIEEESEKEENEQQQEEEQSKTEGEEGEVLGDSVKKVELKDIRDEKLGTQIITEGVISVPPGILGDRIAYLAGSGIQLYFHKENWPDLKVGDRISVSGELASSLGEARLKISQAAQISTKGSTDAPVPKEVSTGAIGEELEGSLVRIAGSITQTSGDTFYIDDGSGEVRIVIKESTNIDKPRTTKGTEASIIGVVSETKSGYRVLPRFQEDVAFGGEVAGLKSFPGAGVLQQLQESDRKGNIIFFFGGAAVMLLLSSAYHSGEPLLRPKNTVNIS